MTLIFSTPEERDEWVQVWGLLYMNPKFTTNNFRQANITAVSQNP